MSEEFDLMNPQSRAEKSLATLTGDYSGDIPVPQSRTEAYLKKLVDGGVTGDLADRVEELEEGMTEKADLENGKVPSTQLPSYVDDVLEFANTGEFPLSGETGKIYVALDTNASYRWSGSAYIEIARPTTFDTTPTQGSTNGITSGAVYDAIGDISTVLASVVSVQP